VARNRDLLHEGHDALARGEWELAGRCLEAVLDQGDSPEALEGLGTVAEWRGRLDDMFDLRERAYRAFREAGRPVDAGRLANQLCWDYRIFRGEPAVSNGWLQSAHRLLDGLSPVPEQGWLALREASLLVGGGELHAARKLTGDAAALGQSLGDVDIEITALALEGLALVNEGRVSDGMSLLDTAATAVIADEMREIPAISWVCCYLIFACERVRDYDRAGQWCERLAAFSERYGSRPLFAVCRTHYAGVLMSRGRWADAERELADAAPELEANATGMVGENLAAVAELRRRQGRLDEAAELVAQVEHRPDGQLVSALLALDRADHRGAADQAERYMRSVGEQARSQRAGGLEVLAKALARLGDLDGARLAAAELDEIAESVGTDPLHGSARMARAAVAHACGDLDVARRAFEDAVVFFQRSGLPYEGALARVALARVLEADGRSDTARRQASLAVAALQELGAIADVQRAAGLVAGGEAAAPPAGVSAPLTAREVEVLTLIAEGLTDPQIAARLFISEHTVHRHVSNILAKLGAPSRAAAVARAAAESLL
jgi:LuxR family maltose regulon positive regulatory protein